MSSVSDNGTMEGSEQYGDAFPTLPSRGNPVNTQVNGRAGPARSKKPGANPSPAAPHIKSSVVTQVGLNISSFKDVLITYDECIFTSKVTWPTSFYCTYSS